MTKRVVLLSLILLGASADASGVMTQSATPDAEGAIDAHLAWVVDLFDGGAAELDVAEVEEHFAPLFLDNVPADEFIATIQQLADRFGPIELVDEQRTTPNEFQGVFASASGERVMISIAVDPQSGLMAGFFITPAPEEAQASPAAMPGASPVATPVATPVAAGPVVEDPAGQLALHDEQTNIIRGVGEPIVEAVLAGDGEAVRAQLTPSAAEILRPEAIPDIINSYTTRQVQMVFAEAGAYFFGQWNDRQMTGIMMQAGIPYQFSLAAEGPQAGERPAGRWTGTIQGVGLDFEVGFSTNDSGTLAATLDIPEQGVSDVALSDVQYLPERPIGEQVDRRIFAPGGQNNSYTADFAWGDHSMRVTVGVDVESGLASSVQILPAIPTPPPAADAPDSNASYRVPFDGTWWVFWGGETELHNYHAATPSQRYAYDLVIWKDGATFSGDGSRNEDYWAWGQPVLAPASGTVVDVVTGVSDLEPNLPLQERGAANNPAGNHVVIETAENEYLFVAHMQQGSVQVEVGDEVQAGDQLGLTGNSGNSSEPHIHVHVQDSPDLLDYQSIGIPLRFETAVVDGEPAQNVLPKQGSFVAPE